MRNMVREQCDSAERFVCESIQRSIQSASSWQPMGEPDIMKSDDGTSLLPPVDDGEFQKQRRYHWHGFSLIFFLEWKLRRFNPAE